MWKYAAVMCIIAGIGVAGPASADDDGIWLTDGMSLRFWEVDGGIFGLNDAARVVDVRDDRAGVMVGNDSNEGTITYWGLVLESVPDIEIDPMCIEEAADAIVSGAWDPAEALDFIVGNCLMQDT